MFVDESEENIFDGFLINNEQERACEWVQEAVEKAPWNQYLKALLSFSYLLDHNLMDPELVWDKAEETAREVLAISPYNEWALAVLLVVLSNEEIEKEPRFFGYNGFRLDAGWYFRLTCLWFEGGAHTLVEFLGKYGPREGFLEIVKEVFKVEGKSK